jgi:hypothetical protein
VQELDLALMSGLSQSYNAVRHELVLSGTAPAFDYELALRNVVYYHAGSQPSAGTRR